MERALHLFDELGDIVEGEPRLDIAEIAHRCLEGPPPGGNAPALQPSAQRLVDDFAEWPAGTARFRLEVGRHVVIQGERRSHVLMLRSKHHDVNTELARPGLAPAATREFQLRPKPDITLGVKSHLAIDKIIIFMIS